MLRVYRCAKCGRKLKPDRWVFSRFTGARYCWPGECKKPRADKEAKTEGHH